MCRGKAKEINSLACIEFQEFVEKESNVYARSLLFSNCASTTSKGEYHDSNAGMETTRYIKRRD